MILVLRTRFPRFANVLSAISGVISLAIAVACHASPEVYVLGGGSSLALAAVRFFGRRRQLTQSRTAAR